MNFKTLIFLGLIKFFFLKNSFIQAQDLKTSEPKITSTEIKLLIDTINHTLKTWCVYPNKAELAIATLNKSYKNKTYEKAKDRNDLAKLIALDVQKAFRSNAFELSYNPELAKLDLRSESDSAKKKNREDWLKSELEENFSFNKIEILPGGIGYIRWDRFTSFIDEATPILNGAFQFVGNCKALVIDLRYNSGGVRSMNLHIQNYFFKQKTHMITTVDNLFDTTKRVTDPSKTNFKLEMPIYILTSRETFSGAEDFAYSFQKTKRAILVGDTTWGRSYVVRGFTLNRTFEMALPISRPIETEDWTDKGLVPNIQIHPEKALAKAQEVIYRTILSKPTNEAEGNLFQRNFNNVLSQLNNLPDSVTLKHYAGLYEDGMNFYVVEGRFFCINAARRGAPHVELNYIGNNLFSLDEYAQVEFIKDSDGTCSKLKMHWITGYVSEKKKIKK